MDLKSFFKNTFQVLQQQRNVDFLRILFQRPTNMKLFQIFAKAPTNIFQRPVD